MLRTTLLKKYSKHNRVGEGEIYILALSQILPYLAQRSGHQENCIVRNKLTTSTMGKENFNFTTNETKIAWEQKTSTKISYDTFVW